MSPKRRERGEVGRIVFAYLSEKGHDYEATTRELAGMTETPTTGFGQYLANHIQAGVLQSRTNERGHIMWRLGPNARTAAQALALAKMRPPPPPPRSLPRSEPEDMPQRVTRVDANAMPSVFAYAASRGAAAFSVAMSTDGRLLIERRGRVVCELTDEERRELVRAASNGVIPS